VTHQGRGVLLVYTRQPNSPVILPTEEFDPRFDHTFEWAPALRYPLIWEDDLPGP
jgi:hypothetical protein